MEPYFLLSLSVIGALVLIGIGLVRASLTGLRNDMSDLSTSVGSVRSNQVRFETLLTGANGDNGISGDVRQLKDWRRELEDAAIVHRMDALERRTGPDDRRTA